MRSTRLGVIVLFLAALSSVPSLRSQQPTTQPPALPATQPAAQPPAVPPWVASLTAEQRTRLNDTLKIFNAQDYKSALPQFRQLHEQAPQNDIVAKFTAEAAVNTGDYDYASSLLAPFLLANPDDPQALGLQAHLYGQQHNIEKRDAVIDHLQKLHDAGKPTPAVVIIERDPLLGGGSVRICDYVQPQDRFHIALMAEFFDASGQRVSRTTLESDDIDQISFKNDHPDQAAAGVRIYSMDSYFNEKRNPQGQLLSQTHATLCPVPGCFITGKPTYELFRSTVLGTNKAAPISTTTSPSK